jgi:V/A-type H+-transporting ATPase subunit K
MDLKKWYVRRVLMLTFILVAFVLTTGLGLAVALAQEKSPQAPGGVTALAGGPRWDISLSIALCLGVPALGGAYAVARVGAAALGAASERPELLVRSLLFVALAEGIAIYGLLMSILLFTKL